ncbi:DUF924 family protein [Luteimonas sp. MC1782]|uniref:DUF924 family protein n=1 Tax=Luteimonas sp. MC1782 TaxID=2760305 RepID=UPI0016017902|nr:DUF924 family protein [Luteimonas sp. MC1782]MBB1473041.1 DUF924 family protein [Luteimonas sp. MC1782]
MPAPGEVVAFWREAGPAKWFARDDAFDAQLRGRFEAAHFAAGRRGLEHWMASAEGALALLLLLDQVPRNIFRDSGHAYACDSLARHYAVRMLDAGLDLEVDPALRVFCYLPFEHSEDLADQERCVALVRGLDPEFLRYAVEHRDVIAQFGRFPHRNRALGRESTAAEAAWLEAGGGF